MPVSAHAAELVAIPWRISRPQGAAWSELSLQFLPLALRWSPSSAGGRQATGAAPAWSSANGRSHGCRRL